MSDMQKHTFVKQQGGDKMIKRKFKISKNSRETAKLARKIRKG